MSWLVRVFSGVAGLALLLALIGLFLPSKARIEGFIPVDRPPATVYTLLANPQVFLEWSPWTRRAPNAEVEFSGPGTGEGAALSWRPATPGATAFDRVIVAAEEYRRIEASIEFVGRGRADTMFTVQPRPGGSDVTWSFEADFGFNLIARYAGLGFQRALGPEFDNGLRDFKAFAEQLPGADFADARARIVDVDSVQVVYIADRMRGDVADQNAAFDAALNEVRGFMAARGVAADGPARKVVTEWEPPLWAFQAAIPYGGRERVDGDGRVIFGHSYAGRAVKVTHRGPGDATATLYAKLDAYIAAHRLERNGGRWEVLVTDRVDTAPEDQITEIYIPVR